MTLTVGSLFSGIGGLDLGLERAGMTVVWQSEIDSYCCQVLARHWPHVPNLGDVTTIEWENVPHVDVICGGYPCQPFSLAGRRLGDRDPRHLWPYMLDAVRVLRPRYALLENVPGHLALGFGRVLGDLAEIGYDTQWDCIPAAAVGAPHLRWRIFAVAYPQGKPSDVRRTELLGRWADETEHARMGSGDVSDSERDQLRQQPGRRNGQERSDTSVIGDDGTYGHVADTERVRLEGAEFVGKRIAISERPIDSGWWATEPDVGRVAHGVPHRVDRLRALGNAVVPQVAEHIGGLIVKAAA